MDDLFAKVTLSNLLTQGGTIGDFDTNEAEDDFFGVAAINLWLPEQFFKFKPKRMLGRKPGRRLL